MFNLDKEIQIFTKVDKQLYECTTDMGDEEFDLLISEKDDALVDTRHTKLRSLIKTTNNKSMTDIIQQYHVKYIKYKNKYLAIKN
jgi:fructose-bisphosphate aldolase class 1